MQQFGPHGDLDEPADQDKGRWIRGRSGGVYEIVRDLPAGGMAEAFVAVRRGLGGFAFPCCVKRMLGAEREEFLQEAHILGSLAHDRIVRAFEVDEDEDGVCFIAMELVDGVNLGELLTYYQRRCQRMPQSLCIYVANEVLEALEYAHGRTVNGEALHVVHRDVTPSNILVGRDGYVKLADFGIARFKSRPDFTRTGIAKGKTAYMSPEHYDKRRGLDHRSDLFSLGVTLYEMICGERAFQTSSDEEALYAVLHGDFQPLHEYAPHVDRDLAALVHRLLDPDKHQRPCDAGDVRKQLRAFEQHPFPRAALAHDVEACIVLNAATERALQRRAAARRGNPALGRARRSAVAAEEPPDGETSGDPSDPAPPAAASTAAPALVARQAPQQALGPSFVPRPTSSRTGRVAVIGASLVLVLTLLTTLVRRRQQEAVVEAPSAVPARVPPAAVPEVPQRAEAPSLAAVGAPDGDSSSALEAAGEEPPVGLAPVVPARVESAASGPTRRRVGPQKTGTLRIKVRAPHGFAWVDGHCYGRAPVVVNDLAPGSHHVGASSDAKTPPSRTQPVKVQAGRETSFEVVLFDPFK